MKKVLLSLAAFYLLANPMPAQAANENREIASYQDEKGVTVEFLPGQVLLRPRDAKDARKEVDEFLARTGGKVVSTDSVPKPPPQLQIKFDPAFEQPTLFAIQVDPSRLNADTSLLNKSIQPSSESAARLLAFIMKERQAGVNITINQVFQPAAMLRRTDEQPAGSAFDNAFDRPEFRADGNRTGVTQAWQFVAARGVDRRVGIAIIDDGFWVDETDRSLSRDLPEHPVQYDFVDNDYIAFTNPAESDGHGTAAAHAAAAALSNHYGVAGTGGLTADAFLFKYDYTTRTLARAVRTAVAWHADVVSMSFSAPAGGLSMRDFSALFREAHDAGLVILGAAGNGGDNVDDVTMIPCIADSVICVGGLADRSNRADGNSGHGASVDLWAPMWGTGLLPSGDPSLPSLETFGGTSFSTPFVAGVVSMMRAVNPSLSPEDILQILQKTAWRDSHDPKVKYALNAFAAVSEAAGHRLPSDRLESSSTPPMLASYDDLTIDSPGDVDTFRFTLPDYSDLQVDLETVPELGRVSVSLTKETGAGWASPGRVVPSATGPSYNASFLSAGTYLLQIWGSAPNLYNMRVTMTPHRLEADEFENNDGGDRAANLDGRVDRILNANFHTEADADYYRLTATIGGFGPAQEEFSIVASEVPVTVNLLDASGRAVASSPRSVIISEPGVHTIRVAGAGRGRYRFQVRSVFGNLRSRYVSPLPYIMPFWINPGNPGPDVFRRGKIPSQVLPGK